MRLLVSIWRYVSTLGGLLSSKVDTHTEDLVASPEGIKSTFRQTRDKWKSEYHEVRDAISQLMMVAEQKREELKRVDKEDAEVAVKKQGSVQKFKETGDVKFQEAFQRFHLRDKELDARRDELQAEIKDLDGKLEKYKRKLTEMQTRIQGLDRHEAEAIADIVSSKQIVELNDRLSGLSTDLQSEQLAAIDKARQKVKAKAKLSDELAGTDANALEEEILSAGMSADAMAEFNSMLGETGLKRLETGGGERNAVDTERPA